MLSATAATGWGRRSPSAARESLHGCVMAGLFFEDWDASFGSPYLIGDDQPEGAAGAVEAADALRIAPVGRVARRTAFVDGVRRGEGLLYRQTADGALVRGTVGAYACGRCCARPVGAGLRADPHRAPRDLRWWHAGVAAGGRRLRVAGGVDRLDRARRAAGGAAGAHEEWRRASWPSAWRATAG